MQQGMAEQNPDSLARTLLDLTLAVELCCGAAANCLILRVFLRKPDLLTVANRFVVNLTVINIIACLTLLPLSIADNEATSSTPMPLLCSLSDFSSHFAASVIPYSVLLIAIDQYFAVVNPLHYHTVINNLRSWWMISAAWFVPFLVAGLGFAESQIYGHKNSVFRACRLIDTGAIGSDSDHVFSSWTWLSLAFSIAFVALSFVLPFTLICYIYSRICAAASGNTKRTQTDLGMKTGSIRATPSERDEIEWDEEETGLQLSVTPALILTRASPPRVDADATRRSCKSATDLCAKEELVVVQETSIKSNSSLPNLKSKRTDKDASLLKPFFPRNTSFSLPSTSVPLVQPPRRHSNDVPIPHIDSDILPKSGTLSKQSSFTSSSRSSSWRIPISRASSIRSTSSFLVSNLRHRLSNAGLFRYRERARAARVSALVIVMALICWLPYFVVYTLRAVIETAELEVDVPQLVNSLVIFFLLLSTIASPALFAYRNRRIRREIRRIFKLHVNDFKSCTRMGPSTNLMQNVKSQVSDLVSKLKIVNGQKTVSTVIPTKLSP